MFQNTVNRSVPFGMVGEVAIDSPSRVSPARIVAKSGTPAAVGRAFGFTETTELGNYQVYDRVTVGAKPFFGILVAPKEYALYGNTTEGPLGASLEMPEGANASFIRMGIVNLDVINGDTAAATITPGSKLYYCAAAGAVQAGKAIATTAADIGKIFAITDVGTDLGTKFLELPGRALRAGAANVASGASQLMRVQLTA